MEGVYYTDQTLRMLLPKVKINFLRYAVWYIIKFSDLVNQLIVHSILDAIGWPKRSIYGERASLTAYYVVMHRSKEKIRKYIKAMYQAAEEGEADCQNLANMIGFFVIKFN